MSKASFQGLHRSALLFPILLTTAIASTASVNASEIKKETGNNAATSTVKIDDVIDVSNIGLQSPLPVSAQQNELTIAPVTQLADPQAILSPQNSDLATVTSVSQLNDVRSSDWAFTALQSLVERYGVIAGYPDSTFRGKQSLSRYEFAAGLNTALDKINEIISAGLADKVSKEDLATLQKLQEEFAAEFSTLRGRVDSLDAKTTKLEQQQFSATTKLSGAAQFLLGTLISNSRTASTNASRSTNTFFTYAANVRLNTSFSGKDLLSINIGTNNAPAISTLLGGTDGGRPTQSNVANFALDGSTATTAPNTFALGQLFYRFPVGEKGTIWLSARGLQFFDYFPLITPLRSGNSTPATVYGLFNPIIFRPGFTNTGIGAAYSFNDQLQIHTGYFASDLQASNPSVGVPVNNNAPASAKANGNGLFGGSSTYAVQLTYKPSDRFAGSLNYVRKYWTGTNGPDNAGQVSYGGPTGTFNAIQPFGDVVNLSDTFGTQFDWRIFPKVGLGGGFTTTAATNLSAPQKATVFSASLSLGFFDLFQEGNHAGILAAITPYVTSNDNKTREDALTPWLIEAFYTHRFNKNVSITPDIFVVLNPDRGNPEPIFGFSLRTTFSF